MKKNIVIITIIIMIMIGLFVVFNVIQKEKNDVYKTGKEIHVKVGESFTYKFDSNGGLPYRWHYYLNDTKLKFLKKGSKIDSKYEGIDGGPIKILFTFKAKEKGTTIIVFQIEDIRKNAVKPIVKEIKVNVIIE